MERFQGGTRRVVFCDGNKSKRYNQDLGMAITMTNLDKLKQAFAEGLGIERTSVSEELQYSSSAWDSIGHMAVIAAIERAFDIMLDTDDVIGMSSFLKAKETVARHGITFDSER